MPFMVFRFVQLQQVDVSGVAPAVHVSDQGTKLRADEPRLNEARWVLEYDGSALQWP